LTIWATIAIFAASVTAAEEVNPSTNQVRDQSRRDGPQEEFKFRYKKPKQRHDDDEAPVPKVVKPALSEAPGATEK
jgi:hypothetical protein